MAHVHDHADVSAERCLACQREFGNSPETPATEVPRLQALLSAVVAATQCLVAEPDLQRGIAAALEALRLCTGLDRVSVFRDQPDHAGVVLYAEALASGIPSIRQVWGDRVFQDREFPGVIPPLRSGEVYQSIHPQRTGHNETYNAAIETRSDLMVPITVAGGFWGIVGFDDCQTDHTWSAAEIDVLRGAALAIAAAVQRDTAQVERLRGSERYQSLLQAVTEALRHLVAEPDLEVGLGRALDALRRLTGVDRVFLSRYECNEQAAYFWLESRAETVKPMIAAFGPGPWPDDVFADVAYPLREGRVYRSLAADRTGRNAENNAAGGSVSDLIVPIFISGRYRACIGFDDNSAPRAWSDAEVAVLQTAASAIASAIARHEADAARALSERTRAAESANLAALLGHVVSSARLLINADQEFFESALHAWLGGFGQAVGAIRCTFYDFVDFEASGQRTARMLAEWVRKGIDGSIPVSFAEPVVIDPRGAELWIAQLTAGLAVALHTEDTTEPMRSFLTQQGNATVVAVPLVMDGQPWGCLNRYPFDGRHEAR